MARMTLSAGTFGPFYIDMDENQIEGKGRSEQKIATNSWVEIPTTVQRPPGQPPNAWAALVSLHMTFFFQRNPDVMLGSAEVKPTQTTISEVPSTFPLRFSLTPAQIEAIEQYRDAKDLHLYIDLVCTVAIGEVGNLRQIQNVTSQGSLKILRSRWTDYVLPLLSYATVEVVEIPVPDEPSAGLFAKAAAALREAQNRYPRDYVACVEECRKVLQPIVDSVRKEEVEASGKEDSGANKLRWYANTNLRPVIGDTWAHAVGEAMAALWGMTSKHHHASPYTPRHDAELGLRLSATLISYVAHVVDIGQKRGRQG